VSEVGPEVAGELARRTSTCWVSSGGRTRAVWCTWAAGGLCVVSGGDEQPLLEVDDGAEVEVLLRSRDTGGRLPAWRGTVSVVRPQDQAWREVTDALAAERLNLTDPRAAPARWAATSTVHRVVPVATEGP